MTNSAFLQTQQKDQPVRLIVRSFVCFSFLCDDSLQWPHRLPYHIAADPIGKPPVIIDQEQSYGYIFHSFLRGLSAYVPYLPLSYCHPIQTQRVRVAKCRRYNTIPQVVNDVVARN